AGRGGRRGRRGDGGRGARSDRGRLRATAAGDHARGSAGAGRTAGPYGEAAGRHLRRPLDAPARARDQYLPPVPLCAWRQRRRAARVHVRVGFRRDGALVAVECDADYDVGAYADIGPRVVQKGTYTATGPYRVPHVELAARAVYTNTTPGGAFRGFGVPQLAW